MRLLYHKGKSCVLQCIPAYVNIEGNKWASSLAKEARYHSQPFTTITPTVSNAVGGSGLIPKYFNPLAGSG
ncbi:hypothetical protein TNCV_4054121 [Trichonephila clavipes]|nr:hypothetical protein TNCV_4054121 [Trichonephila clavipes]